MNQKVVNFSLAFFITFFFNNISYSAPQKSPLLSADYDLVLGTQTKTSLKVSSSPTFEQTIEQHSVHISKTAKTNTSIQSNTELMSKKPLLVADTSTQADRDAHNFLFAINKKEKSKEVLNNKEKKEKQQVKLKKEEQSDSENSNFIKTLGEYGQGFEEATDKEEYLKGLAQNVIETKVNSSVNDFFNAYTGVNSQIQLSLTEEGTIEPSGKILIPLYTSTKNTTFLQSGLQYSFNDNKIWHLGIGQRWYPFAESEINSV